MRGKLIPLRLNELLGFVHLSHHALPGSYYSRRRTLRKTQTLGDNITCSLGAF